ncbi:META domain-containing protein [Faecalibacter macacae]|uniref:META domain-containing protein n=1 Tax=Faecalibacter macacae TaxID=1859289 RepID=A0A3L9M3D4_9FLAO|nr:META domain-containing protein [Faecalibacter macacae]RLZ07342.1 META domain-containing protein [Faecalibacter macacae]
MKLVKVLSVFALSGLLLTACSTSTGASTGYNVLSKSKSSLTDTQWNLVEEDEIVKGFNGDNVHITITEDGKLNGYAGCNQIFSEGVLNGSSIKFDLIGGTKILCPSNKTEESFTSILKSVDRYEIKGNELYFYKGNMLLLKFKN